MRMHNTEIAAIFNKDRLKPLAILLQKFCFWRGQIQIANFGARLAKSVKKLYYFESELLLFNSATRKVFQND